MWRDSLVSRERRGDELIDALEFEAMPLYFSTGVFVLERKVIELSVFFINRRSDSSIWKKRNKWTWGFTERTTNSETTEHETQNELFYTVEIDSSFILSSLDEFGGRRIRIHSNMHFHNWTTSKRYHSRRNGWTGTWVCLPLVLDLPRPVSVVVEREFARASSVHVCVHLHASSLPFVDFWTRWIVPVSSVTIVP